MQQVFAVNTFGVALAVRYLLPLLPRARRSIFASISARVGSIGDNQLGGWYSYRASKAAQNMVIRTGAIEAKRTRPHLVCVTLHPGTVKTALSDPFTKRSARPVADARGVDWSSLRALGRRQGFGYPLRGMATDHLVKRRVRLNSVERASVWSLRWGSRWLGVLSVGFRWGCRGGWLAITSPTSRWCSIRTPSVCPVGERQPYRGGARAGRVVPSARAALMTEPGPLRSRKGRHAQTLRSSLSIAPSDS